MLKCEGLRAILQVSDTQARQVQNNEVRLFPSIPNPRNSERVEL